MPPAQPPCRGATLLSSVPLVVAPGDGSGLTTSSTVSLANITGGQATLDCDAGLIYTRPFAPLGEPAPGASGRLYARIQGRQYLDSTQDAALARASSVRGVLRTTSTYVDRRGVQVAFQLHDARGNVRVLTSGIAVEMRLSTSGLSSVSTTCNVDGLNHASSHYLGYCAVELPHAWFASSRVASATLSVSYGGEQVAAIVLTTPVQVVQRPSWYGAHDSRFSSATAFGVLPASPLYADEQFSLELYAHTGGFALSTFWVWATIDVAKLNYHSFTQSSLFRTVGMDRGGSDGQTLRFAAVGLQGSTTDAQVTSTALHLVTVRLSIKPGTVGGVHDGAVTVYARQFVNPGSNVRTACRCRVLNSHHGSCSLLHRSLICSVHALALMTPPPCCLAPRHRRILSLPPAQCSIAAPRPTTTGASPSQPRPIAASSPTCAMAAVC